MKQRLTVGSKVTVVNIDRQCEQSLLRHTVGTTGKLIEDANDYQPYLVTFDYGGNYWYYDDNLELAKEDNNE